MGRGRMVVEEVEEDMWWDDEEHRQSRQGYIIRACAWAKSL